MFQASQYELLDFGAGRKLEQFGPLILDRPAPAAADIQRAKPELWSDATARFELDAGGKSQIGMRRGRWITSLSLPVPWTIRHHEIHFELKITPFGHVGVFPEQATNWDWLGNQARQGTSASGPARLRVLNLFAYTGGSTLAAAAAGAEVTHVDAARNIVAWARRNAELSGLSAAPIRWIVDDALKFARRELKRGKRYDAVILDPPSYGHGSAGESWKLDDHLAELLTVCRELAGPQPRFVLLTCHAPDYDAQRLAECLVTAGFVERAEQIQAGDLSLCTADDRSLPAGKFARIASIRPQPDSRYR